jgi:multidrug resistance efflux pump
MGTLMRMKVNLNKRQQDLDDANRDIAALIKENLELKHQIAALQSAYQGAMINLQNLHLRVGGGGHDAH